MGPCTRSFSSFCLTRSTKGGGGKSPCLSSPPFLLDLAQSPKPGLHTRPGPFFACQRTDQPPPDAGGENGGATPPFSAPPKPFASSSSYSSSFDEHAGKEIKTH